MLIRRLLAAALLLCLSIAAAPSVAQPEAAQTFDAEEEQEIDRLFRTGMAAMSAAHGEAAPEARAALLDQAIEDFRTILVRRPGLVRVRLELARSLFLQGEDSLARRHFEQVLAGDVPETVAENINRFLSTIRARKRWAARFGFAIAPDTNVNAASGDRTIWLDTPFGRLLFTRDESAIPKSGLGLSLWGGGEYQHPISARLRLRAGADVSMREYKGSDSDSHVASAYAGPRWLVDPTTEASLLATVQRQWSAGQPDSDQFGFRLETEHRLTPRVTLQGRLGLRRRNSRSGDSTDGPVGDATLSASWAALPVLRLSGDAGYNWSNAKEKERRSAGPRAGLGGSLALPAGFTLDGRAALQWTNYEGTGAPHNTIDQKERGDRMRILSVSVHNRAFTAQGFSPRLSLINERRKTNAQGLGYRRNRAELSFVRQF